MTNLHLTLTPRTPIWTGGIQRQSDRLHETGFIGSLRWWYEAIVRGLGGHACDPTSHQCALDEEKFKQPPVGTVTAWRSALGAAGLCDVCQAYGATGWGRRFSLRAGRVQTLDFEEILNETLNIRPSDRTGGWYLGAGIVPGQTEPSIQALVLSKPHFDTASLLVPLSLASQRAALGARCQHGYGVVDVAVQQDKQVITVQPGHLARLPAGVATDDLGLPSLRNMFFATITLNAARDRWWANVADLAPPLNLYHNRLQAWNAQLKTWTDSGSVPISPVVRNYLRFRNGLGITSAALQNYVFGTIKPVCRDCYRQLQRQGNTSTCSHCGDRAPGQIAERVKTKLSISDAYPIGSNQWQLRIWGWLPHTPPAQLTVPRDTIFQALQKAVTDPNEWSKLLGPHVTLASVDWREFASARDAATGAAEDARAYLKSLLQAEEL